MRSLISPQIEGNGDPWDRQEAVSVSNNNVDSSLQGGLGEAKQLMERLNVAQVKVKRLNRLEAALVDFFMEIMDRTEGKKKHVNGNVRSLETESVFARGKRKEQFLKKAEGDPISLLNALRTHLRLQFANEEAQQAAADRKAIAETKSNQQKEQNTRHDFQQMELTCNSLKQQREVLNQQLNQLEFEQTRSRRQHQLLIESLNAQLQAERSKEQSAQQLITQQLQEIEVLKEAKDALITSTQGQRQYDNAKAAGASVTDGTTFPPARMVPGLIRSPTQRNGDCFGTPAENQTLRRALRKYDIKMAKMEAVNEDRKRELQRLQQQLTGLRQNAQLQMYVRLEKESRHLRELADDLKKRLSESDADLLRTKGSLKERESQIHQMNEEYSKLFNAVQKQKQPSHYSPSKLSRTPSALHLAATVQPNSSRNMAIGHEEEHLVDNAGSAAGSEHPYVVEHYRAETARVEREAEALKLQIRRMMASEQLYKQKTRVLRAEKQNLIRERDQLRADLDRSTKYNTLQSVAMNRRQDSTTTATQKTETRDISHEVKRLQKRNDFLEERFRKSLKRNSSFATLGAVARLRNSVSVPSGLEIDTAAPEDPPKPKHVVDDSKASEISTIGYPKSETIAVKRPVSAFATKAELDAFKSLDAATLQLLHQVKRSSRVRPQSAASIR